MARSVGGRPEPAEPAERADGSAAADVVSGRFEVTSARGMHVRAASKLVNVASRYPCEILLSRPSEQPVNGKSVMGVLLLCGAQGTRIDVRATGPGAAEAVAAIGALFAGGFEESE